MTKTLKTIILLVAISMSGLSISYAQSKKKLKAEITELKTENAQLQRESDGLDRENESLRKENQSFLDQNGQLRQQVTQLQRDYDALNREHQTLTSDYEALKGSSVTGGGSGNGSSSGGGTLPSAGDDRKCAFYQGNLSVNTSYTESFGVLNTEGWGVQVNAYRNLCQAAEKAEAFKKKFSRYKTYIRCKESNGIQIYAVIYGSLREREQAKTYLNNLKKKYRSTFGSSFLVQH